MKKDSLMHQLFLLLIVSGGVYLGFIYLLPLFFPFLLAYFFMRMLWPVINYLYKNCGWPRPLASYSVLFAFFSLISLTVIFLFEQILGQLRLFFANFPFYHQLVTSILNRQTTYMCKCIDHYLRLENGTCIIFLSNRLKEWQQQGFDMLTSHAGKTIAQCLASSFHFIVSVLILVISMFILVKEMAPINEKYRNSRYFPTIHAILISLKKSGLTYLRTELLILVVNAAVCSLGLFLIHNSYFFILGIGIAIFDAFPVMGSGFIFLPWCIFSFFNQDYYYAAILVTTYLATLFIREFLEAKLLGKGMGISPFFMIAAIFIGIELFGVAGIFLGPFAIVLIRAILSELRQLH